MKATEKNTQKRQRNTRHFKFGSTGISLGPKEGHGNSRRIARQMGGDFHPDPNPQVPFPSPSPVGSLSSPPVGTWGEIHPSPLLKRIKRVHVFPKKGHKLADLSGLSGEFHICQAIYHQMKQFMWAYGVLPLPVPPTHLCAILAARRPAALRFFTKKGSPPL